MMTFIHKAFDLILGPFLFFPPVMVIGLLAFISTIFVLLIFKTISNQHKIKYHKDKIVGYILESYLYRDQISRTLLSQLNILKYNLYYLRYMIAPLLVILLPLVIIMFEIDYRWGSLPLQVNDSFVVCAELDKNRTPHTGDFLSKIHCETSEGINIETPPLRIASESRLFWRARVLKEGGREYIRLKTGDSRDIFERQIVMNSKKMGAVPKQVKRNSTNHFFFGIEYSLPGRSPFKLVSVSYRPARYGFLLWRFDPIVLFILLTLCFGFIIKPFFKVRI